MKKAYATSNSPRSLKTAAAISLMVLLAATTSRAQIVKGTIVGTIRDASGAVVPGATVTVRNLATNVTITATANEIGNYIVPFLDEGRYSVSAEAPGFKRAVEPGVKLDVGARVRVDLILEVGETTEVVEVRAAAPLVETDTSSTGMTVTEEKLRQLPLLGRNYQALAQVIPTAVSPTFNPVAAYMNMLTTGTYWQVAGQRGAYTSYTFDGINTNNWLGFQGAGILPSLDSIGEFRIETHNFGAEHGRGTVQFTATTRAGTNVLHGSVYEFHRNDALNANDFFLNKAGRTKRAFRYNQFGFTVGGPIILPGYDGRDKSFFFFGYEGTRFVSSGTAFGRYPDPAWLTGDFSDLKNSDGTPRLIYDPLTVRSDGRGGFIRDPFPNNRIPRERFDRVAAAAIQFIPRPTSLTDIIPGVNTVGTTRDKSSPNYWVMRLDHNFSQRDRLYGRYMQSRESLTSSSLAPLSGSVKENRAYNVMVSETHVFSPRIVNEIRLGYNRANFGAFQEGFLGRCIKPCEKIDYVKDVFGLQNAGAGPLSWGIPNFSWSGYSGIGGPVDSPLVLWTDTYQVSDNLIMTFGRHSMKAGFVYQRVPSFYASQTFTRGFFGFNGQFTQGTQSGQQASGSPFADFLLGYSFDVRGLSGDASGHFRTAHSAYYFQDDFRVSSKLTLNLGLRYEYYSPYTAASRGTTRFDFGFVPGSCFGPGCPPGRIVFLKPGEPLYEKNWNNWGPRVGFAYSPFGDNKTAIRASYGIFYSPSDGTDNGTWGVFNPPNALNFFFAPQNPFTDLTTTKMDRQFPGGTMPPLEQLRTDIWPLPPLSLLTEIPVMEEPTIHQWQLTVQRELVPNLVFEVGYMGSRGYHGQRRINYNQARLDNPGELTPLQARLPYPKLSSFLFVAEHSAINSYHAGWLRIERRFTGGFSFVSSYTFGKTIDDYGNLNGPGAFWPQYSYRKDWEKGLSAFHAPHRFTAGYVWEIPFGRGRRFGSGIHPVLDGILGGWQVSGITTFQSGNPLHPTPARDWSNTGQFNWTQRPDIVRPVQYVDPRKTESWFNADAFAPPALGAFGNAARGVLRGPGINNWDLMIAKNFNVKERTRIQFRAEMFNAFNHTQFAGVFVTIDPSLSNLIGKVTSARSPRNIQLALRVEF